MFEKYTDSTEFMRLIADKKIRPAAIRKYMSKQGMLFTATDATDLAKDVYTFFLGGGEMSDITQLVASESNYEKSTLINAKLDDSVTGTTDLLDFFSDSFNHAKASSGYGYTLDQPVRTQTGLTVTLTYRRKLYGKNSFMDEEIRHAKINIRKHDARNVSIDIRHSTSIDAQKALELLDQLINPGQEQGQVHLSHVNLEVLTDKNKVDFFDRIAVATFPNWRLKTITSITVQRGSWKGEDDEEAEEITDYDNPTGTLAGISQAVLNGSGLRSNAFVQGSLDQGYIISAMKYRYECTKEAGEFVVSICSRGKDLRVDVDKSYCDEDGRLFIQPFPRVLQDEIIQLFQNTSNDVFYGLCKEQATAARDKNVKSLC